MIEKLIIIGSGPSAMTAAIYAGRAGLSPLVFEGEMAGGIPPGGQLTTTTDIENFPGFENGISGIELMMAMRAQALRFNTRILTKTITQIKISSSNHTVMAGDEAFSCEALIIATGATAKRLGMKGESKYWQKGISACAVCDGGLPLFRNQHLVVVGGGDTAIEEAITLSQYASKVTLCVRREVLRASDIMQKKLFNNKKISILWNTVILEALGDERTLTHLRIQNTKDQTISEIETKGLFYAIGHSPNTQFLNNQINLTETGYIIIEQGTTRTSVSGVFAAGDVMDPHYRQAIVAAGSGCMASLDAQHYLIGNFNKL